MTPPERFGDLAAVFLARTWHNQGEPMPPEHDPQVLDAREHLKRHLDATLALLPITDEERGNVIDTLLDSGDIHHETRGDFTTAGAPVAVLNAVLTIRHPYPVGTTWPEPGDVVDGRVVLDADDDRFAETVEAAR